MRFYVRGFDVELKNKTDIVLHLGPSDAQPVRAEQITLQVLMYLDAEGFIDLGTTIKPSVKIQLL